jgi:hypothetical protein
MTQVQQQRPLLGHPCARWLLAALLGVEAARSSAKCAPKRCCAHVAQGAYTACMLALWARREHSTQHALPLLSMPAIAVRIPVCAAESILVTPSSGFEPSASERRGAHLPQEIVERPCRRRSYFSVRVRQHRHHAVEQLRKVEQHVDVGHGLEQRGPVDEEAALVRHVRHLRPRARRSNCIRAVMAAGALTQRLQCAQFARFIADRGPVVFCKRRKQPALARPAPHAAATIAAH